RFEIDIDAPRTGFFAAIEHIEIIRLEETENSLLSSVWKYFKTPSGMGSVNEKSVVLFDDEGNYKNAISNYGRGPKEYTSIGSVQFNNGAIELFSGGSRLINRYTEEGGYIETIKGKYSKEIWAGSAIPYKSGYILQHIYPGTPNNPIPFHVLLFTDGQLNIVGEGGYTKNLNTLPLNLGKHFSTYEDHIYFKKILNDSVYQIINGKEYPKFRFDFGKDWAWSDPKNTSTHQIEVKVTVEGDKVIDVLSDVGSKYIMLTYYISTQNEQKGYINRETGKFTRFDMRKKDKEKYKLKFIKWEDDRLV
ncbi:6-bladed beta-propeller, partial [Roseivirga echinicomitans]|uniref:6-bladed beta-propeller n=1 Tax=Roseivirga echinicomitans TaxID=296218 RepID=UPI0012FD59A3